ncbi:MAG TPA: amino acid-binding protein [Nocardioidaceae bacterium]|nr:amino acid-binding protein [Nocardioidaceae bacterium]
MAFLLRVTLPDVPGSLGTLAGALGAAGADIEAIEIVEHGSDGRAVDDVLLELPPSVLPDMVVSACQRLEGVDVLWISRYTAGANLHLDLEAVESLTEEPAHAVSRLVGLVPVVFRSDWALLVQRAGNAVAVLDGTSAAPAVDEVSDAWLPMPRARRLAVPEGVAWESALMIGVPVGSPDLVLVAGRRGGPEFLDSEIARMAHLAGLAASIAASVDPADVADAADVAEPSAAVETADALGT